MSKPLQLNDKIWKFELSLFESHDDIYFDSEFAAWERRVRQTHQEEVDQIEQAYSEAIASMSDEAVAVGYDPDDIYGEQYYETYQVTNKMYAGLIVALWSHMESTLSKLVSISQMATGKREDIVRDLKLACEDILNGTSPDEVELKTKAKAALDYSRRTWKFDEIKSALKNTLGSDLTNSCPYYNTLNTTRLLCNTFKHKDGRCDADLFSQLDLTVRDNAKIKPNEAIDYSSLDMEALVTGCRDSIRWIIKEIRNVAC